MFGGFFTKLIGAVLEIGMEIIKYAAKEVFGGYKRLIDGDR